MLSKLSPLDISSLRDFAIDTLNLKFYKGFLPVLIFSVTVSVN